MKSRDLVLKDLERSRNASNQNDRRFHLDHARALIGVLIQAELENVANAFTRIADHLGRLEDVSGEGSPPSPDPESVPDPPDES